MRGIQYNSFTMAISHGRITDGVLSLIPDFPTLPFGRLRNTAKNILPSDGKRMEGRQHERYFDILECD